MANSTHASQARLVCQVAAPSAMLKTVSMPPSTARQHASSVGANKDVWIAALLQRQRRHWTAALASHLVAQIPALRLRTWVLAVLTTRASCLIRKQSVQQAPSVA